MLIGWKICIWVHFVVCALGATQWLSFKCLAKGLHASLRSRICSWKLEGSLSKSWKNSPNFYPCASIRTVSEHSVFKPSVYVMLMCWKFVGTISYKLLVGIHRICCGYGDEDELIRCRDQQVKGQRPSSQQQQICPHNRFKESFSHISPECMDLFQRDTGTHYQVLMTLVVMG